MANEEAPEAIPLAQDVLHVGKREVVAGRVRVHTRTDQRTEVVDQDLLREHVEVSRVPVDREVETVPQIREEGGVTIIPIVEEVLVVEKRLVLKEEVHIRRTHSVDHVETSVVLRKQEAIVERLEASVEDPSLKDTSK